MILLHKIVFDFALIFPFDGVQVCSGITKIPDSCLSPAHTLRAGVRVFVWAIMLCQQGRGKILSYPKVLHTLVAHGRRPDWRMHISLEAACIFMIRVRLINKANFKMEMQQCSSISTVELCQQCVPEGCHTTAFFFPSRQESVQSTLWLSENYFQRFLGDFLKIYIHKIFKIFKYDIRKSHSQKQALNTYQKGRQKTITHFLTNAEYIPGLKGGSSVGSTVGYS